MKAILGDVKVELLDQFDRNFDRKAFFDQPWEKRMRNYSRGTLMAVTNRTRRSLRGRLLSNGIRFATDAPGAPLHNAGGKVRVTSRMRRYFWAQYYKHAGMMKATQSGKVSQSKRNVIISGEAEFWRNMALRKSDTITMPKRQFVGNHRKVSEKVNEIANRAVREYAEKKLLPILKK